MLYLISSLKFIKQISTFNFSTLMLKVEANFNSPLNWTFSCELYGHILCSKYVKSFDILAITCTVIYDTVFL